MTTRASTAVTRFVDEFIVVVRALVRQVRERLRQLHDLERVALWVHEHRDLDRRTTDRHRGHVAVDRGTCSLRGGHRGGDVRYAENRVVHWILRHALALLHEELG